MLENSRSRPKSPPYFSIMSGGQISGPFRRNRQRCTIQSAAHSDSLILLLSVMFDVITSPPQRRSSSSSAVTLTPCCQSKATPKRVLKSRSSFGSFGSSPIGVTTSGRSVGGGANSIFGFCSCSKQWSKHWSTTISISSSSGHSRLGQGDHQTSTK
uniref:Uncharacterized protein n=1 Tax=Anopheles coluzzii TaxID=1518534 RepID=A0A8W7PKQ9_ANOCL